MSLPTDLLSLARYLVDRNPGAPIEADLRRGVSTAYYALFHLLVEEAIARIVAHPTLRSRVARSLSHDKMKQVCQKYADPKVDPITGEMKTKSGLVVNTQLKDIAFAFVASQYARQQADYDTGTPLRQADADIQTMTVEVAFLDWNSIRADPSAGVFLTELFLRSVSKR
jgi:hypothetical protein